MMIRRQGRVLRQIGNDHRLAGGERAGARRAPAFGDPPQAVQRWPIEAAVVDEGERGVVDRQLDVAELGAVQGDHVGEDVAQPAGQRALAQQAPGHLREHGKQQSTKSAQRSNANAKLSWRNFIEIVRLLRQTRLGERPARP
jgi:hypothetical protein